MGWQVVWTGGIAGAREGQDITLCIPQIEGAPLPDTAQGILVEPALVVALAAVAEALAIGPRV